MGVKIRVLATRLSDAPIARLIYTAEVVDDEVPAHAPAMWTCGHNHRDPQAAYSCAVGWMKKAGITESTSLPRESTAS